MAQHSAREPKRIKTAEYAEDAELYGARKNWTQGGFLSILGALCGFGFADA
jgi:hypothetical protein